MKKKKDYLLIYLILISLLNVIIISVFGIESQIRYVALFFHVLVMIFCKEEDILALIFFIRPNFGLYDGCGFKLFFNITIAICAIKLLLSAKKRKQLRKEPLLVLILLFLYDILLTLINNIDFYFLLTYVSLFLSYIILIIYSNDKEVDFGRIYIFYATGMIMSAICGIFIPLSQFGMIPKGYRFAALMRDSNGYSLELLLLIITAPLYEKITGKNSLIFVVLFFILGFLGVSKMFLICSFFIILYNLFFSKKTINKKSNIVSLKNILIFIFLLVIMFVINNKFDFISLISNNYIARFSSTELTSGRNEIASYYIRYLFQHPVSLLFGKSLEYYKIIGYQGWGMAHNTWLELLLSFGIIGTLLYFIFIIKIFKNAKINKILYKKELILLILIFSFCLNALPILSGDALAILILYVILVKNINKKEEAIKNDEKN